MSTIRVTVEVPELSSEALDALRCLYNDDELSDMYGPINELLRADAIMFRADRFIVTRLGRAVLEHYGEGGR